MNQSVNVELPAPVAGLRRVIKQPRYMHYNRLIAGVFLINALLLLYGAIAAQWWASTGIELRVIADITLLNLSITILVRQQYVINFMFWLATRAPTSWPLSLRWTLGKVYHHGGLHKGGAMAGTLWFMILPAVPAINYSIILTEYRRLAWLSATP